MPNRFLEYFLLAFFFSIPCVSFSSENEKECAPTLDAIIAKRYGAGYKDDENITVEKLIGTPFIWVIDNTPSVNPDRILLETTANESCVILNAPMANSISFEIGRNLELPQKAWTETSKTNGFDRIRTTYVKRKNSNSYETLKCEKIRLGKKPARFDCNGISAE